MRLHVTNNTVVVTDNEIVLEDATQNNAICSVPKRELFLNEMTIGERTIELTKPFGHFLGMYIGDGWCDNNHNKINLATVEEDHKQLFIDYVNKFLRDTDLKGYKKANTTHYFEGYLSTHGKASISLETTFKNHFKDTFGHGAKNKHFPKELVYGNREFLFGLLSGLIDTDGTINSSEVMKKGKMQQNKNAMYETSSPYLALLVQSLCFSLGINASINIHRRDNKNIDEIKVIMSTIDIYRERDNLCIMDRKKQELNAFVFGDQVNWKDIVPFPREYRAFLSSKGIKTSVVLCNALRNGYMVRETLYTMFNDEQIQFLRDRFDIDNRKFETVVFSKETEEDFSIDTVPSILTYYLIKESKECKK